MIEKRERIKKALDFLKGQFDGVIIIATDHKDATTNLYSEQDGNEFAVEAAVESWIEGDVFFMEDL